MASPNLIFYTTGGTTLSVLSFGTLTAGQQSDVEEVVLWNNYEGTFAVDDAINCLISARLEAASEINDPIEQGWVFIRSDGVENPEGVANFFDDDQTVYTQITRHNHLTIGDIPEYCGRHIFVKIIVPDTAPSQADVSIRLVAGTGVHSYPLPYFFNRAFGDGPVDNLVRQIFPAILQQRIGVWTDVLVIPGGRYTGLTAKEYLVKVAAGTTIGYLTYQTSDNNGSSYSSAITSSTSAFTSVYTSANVDEGVTLQFQSAAGQSLAVGDLWKINVAVDPFSFVAGISSSREGYVGYGEALVYNNRVFHQSPTRISGLTASDVSYVFMDFEGEFDVSLSANHQSGKILLGWFETDSTKVTSALRIHPKVTMGLDLFDDFGPIMSSIGGLTFVYNRGKYKEFNEIVSLPSSGAPYGTMTLLPGVTNYIQIEPVSRTIITKSTGYDEDSIPLFRIGTDATYIKGFEDDRTRIGVTTFSRSYTGTVSSIPTGSSSSFTFTDFFTRGDVKKLVITPTQAGGCYSVFLYEDSSHFTLEYSAENLSGTYTDPVDWWHHCSTKDKKMYGRIDNNIGATSTFTLDLRVERFA